MTETRTGRSVTSKGEQTRAKILETALALFLERGYQETTMRAIASDAGVSLGNAYYYFRSKEHLIQAFYLRTHTEHLVAARPVLESETDFEKRLLGVMKAKLETIEVYHQFSGQLFRTAADPASPLNPFSDESEETRQESTALFEEVIAGSKIKLSKDMRRELPHLLWVYHMGVVLYWLHDDSPGRRRTHKLIGHTVPLVTRIVSLGSLPVLRTLTKRTLTFLAELREERDTEEE